MYYNIFTKYFSSAIYKYIYIGKDELVMVNITVFTTIKKFSSVLWGKKNPTFARRNAYTQASLDGNFRIMTNIDKPKVLRMNLM